MRLRLVTLALLACACALPVRPLAAQSRTLTWPRFEVTAHLDSSGAPRVRERQVMRFSGDWNGGERRFDVGLGQRFVFHGLSRLDSVTGQAVPLREGDIDAVDGYDWFDNRTLRWRSRRPTDPPFSNTDLTYELDYSYNRILVPDGDRYTLDHQFAFRDRDGMIEAFSLTLTIDSAWQVPAWFTGRWSGVRLPPGESFLVTVPLEWRGGGVPAGVLQGAPTGLRTGIAAVGIAAMVALVLALLRRERANGRFAPLPAGPIDERWLQTRVFSMRPEVVGAAWDRAVGAPEVAATLARLVSQGTLRSSVKTRGRSIFKVHDLHLTLQTRREQLGGYERALIDALFSSGSTSTSTSALRTRYARTGFDPASIIRSGVEAALERVPEAGALVKPPRSWPITLALLGAALAAGALAATRSAVDGVTCAAAVGVALVAWILAGMQALFWQARVVRAAPHALRFLLPLAALGVLLLYLAQLRTLPIGLAAVTCAALLAVAVTWSVLHAARSRESPERVQLRKRLAAAREHFRHELQQASPALQDAWYPYLLAFGLNRLVNRWFKAHGPETQPRMHRPYPATSGSSGSTGGSGWSGFGGGGGFAGAGATVAFGAAISGFSSGVAAPSSSGSGGGSSSSGGSSGGGGGGGW